jgi:archaellum component FlaC
MTAMTLDTLDFARKLRDGGVEEKTADTIAREVGHFVVENLATPAEVAQIKGENADIKTRLTNIETDIAGLKTEMAEVKTRLTRLEVGQHWLKWGMGVIIAVLLGVVWQLIAISQQIAALAARLPPP